MTTTRRDFAKLASAATLGAFAVPRSSGLKPPPLERVFVASHAADGIVAFDWDPTAAALTRVVVAAKVPNVAWLARSGNFIYSASELDTFEDKPTGEVASFLLQAGELRQLSARNSAGTGTCHVAVDATARMLVAADYTGGSAASFQIRDGKLSEAVWTEHYIEHGPNKDRQEKAHAHFASFSPDNWFAYVNDLGGDSIHIYRCDPATAQMTAAGEYRGAPGGGPRTLHFHPNGKTAYCMNELVSTVDVLDWHKPDGSLSLVDRIELLPADYRGPTRGCDTVITRDGRFVYFANRDDNFLYSFRADPATGCLKPIKRSNCGGKTPRSFTLDRSERWMLVANQDSNGLSVFARDAATGLLSDEVHSSVEVEAPMRILFV